MRFRTRAIHGGQAVDPHTGAVVPPIYLATTYVQPGPGEWGKFDYIRSGSPTRAAFEQLVASLESGEYGLAFSSGMAAIHCVCMLLRPGEHIVAGGDLYGGTFRLFRKVLPTMGIETSFAPAADLDQLAAAFRPETKLLWVETPGNPLLSIADLAACAELAHRYGALLGVDNTFATPVLTRPLEKGADIVMHSATKYLGGHSDLLGGVLVVRDRELYRRLYFLQNATGATLGPWEAYMGWRGLRTLELRVREQCRSAMLLAERLAKDPRITRVLYPGLAHHPGHQLACRQMEGGFGAMITLELPGAEAAKTFVRSTHLFALAVSLGAVESLIEHPATMSHASCDAQHRENFGITDRLVRLSIGLEDPEDLWDDLDQALTKATKQG